MSQKRVYVASASKGDRVLLKGFVQEFMKDAFLFAPCLGFHGTETPQIRDATMDACFYIVANWAEVFIMFKEDVHSEGSMEELMGAIFKGLPCAVFDTTNVNKLVNITGVTHILGNIDELRTWLNGL